jgi:hypothetical protein
MPRETDTSLSPPLAGLPEPDDEEVDLEEHLREDEGTGAASASEATDTQTAMKRVKCIFSSKLEKKV